MNPFEIDSEPPPPGPLDKLVLAGLERAGIKAPRLCSDAVFVRRAFLDLIGTLPTARESREFLLDKRPDKRAALVDRLLARDEYADYWAMKWSDLLRVKAEFPINLWPNAAQAYHRWIRTSIKENKPYHRFARDLLTSSGSNFRVPQVNFYRAVQSKEPAALAQAVALVLMGTRAEKWPKERLAGMAGFFSQLGYKSTAEWKEEIVFFDRSKPPAPAAFPDGTPAQLPPDQDPRTVLADWLLAPRNPWFARTIANRVWSWLLGRGIIHEPDDARPDNPPSNPQLLEYLEGEVVAVNFDLKRLKRLITTSRTYQHSGIPPAGEQANAVPLFARYPLRRLDAEVLIDALNQLTGTTEKYSSPIPEPFTFIPEDQRSIALPDGSITSPFLEMFGRPPRDTGLESERNNRTSPAQRLHMLNSSHVQRKLEQGRKIQALIQSPAAPKDLAADVYLTILSRFPTADEVKAVETYCTSSSAKGRQGLLDLVWTLINSAEFLYRH